MNNVTIELTLDEFRDLLQLVAIGTHVRSTAKEAEGSVDPERDEALEEKLYALALAAGMPEAKQHQHGDHAHIGPSESFEEATLGFVDLFVDDQFWDELTERLAKRDHDKGAPDENRMKEREEFYKREFETFGIDRLEIDKNSPVSDLREIL